MPLRKPKNTRAARLTQRADGAGITKEALEAKKAELEGVVHLRKLSPPTLAMHARLIDVVIEYLNRLEEGAGDTMRETGVADKRLNGASASRFLSRTRFHVLYTDIRLLLRLHYIQIWPPSRAYSTS